MIFCSSVRRSIIIRFSSERHNFAHNFSNGCFSGILSLPNCRRTLRWSGSMMIYPSIFPSYNCGKTTSDSWSIINNTWSNSCLDIRVLLNSTRCKARFWPVILDTGWSKHRKTILLFHSSKRWKFSDVAGFIIFVLVRHMLAFILPIFWLFHVAFIQYITQSSVLKW